MRNYSINDIQSQDILQAFDKIKGFTLSDVAKSQIAINLLVEFQNSGGQLIYDPNAKCCQCYEPTSTKYDE